MGLNIVKINEQHWKDLRTLRLEALEKEPTAFGKSYKEECDMTEEDWRKKSVTKNGNKLIAYLDGEPVGMVEYYFETLQKLKHIATIYSMYVRPEYRQQKIGKKLLEQALEDIKQNEKVEKVKLLVNSSNEGACQFYRNFGFQDTGIFHKEMKVDGVLYDEIAMELFL